MAAEKKKKTFLSRFRKNKTKDSNDEASSSNNKSKSASSKDKASEKKEKGTFFSRFRKNKDKNDTKKRITEGEKSEKPSKSALKNTNGKDSDNKSLKEETVPVKTDEPSIVKSTASSLDNISQAKNDSIKETSKSVSKNRNKETNPSTLSAENSSEVTKISGPAKSISAIFKAKNESPSIKSVNSHSFSDSNKTISLSQTKSTQFRTFQSPSSATQFQVQNVDPTRYNHEPPILDKRFFYAPINVHPITVFELNELKRTNPKFVNMVVI